MPEYIRLTPQWEPVVRVLLGVIANPTAPQSAKDSAEEEILRLARAMDQINAANDGDRDDQNQ